ncbi:HIT family hydrolase [Oceanobacillus sp. E9]|uniref:HIT domain-containing protein n=1 Tax=Oceanobacillus TaxID=182709 RepID=UPI000347D7DA|nr:MULTISPECIES: HIT domain-containing protein [Oceanobacillus]OEH54407.1 HIT family hydrolase [Oceanobacillus sp. E9]
MMEDFYCDEVLSGNTLVEKVVETENVLAYHHTNPYWPTHIVAIPKVHIDSLLSLEEKDNDLLLELFFVIKQVATMVKEEDGACRVITNLGNYQDSKHLHWHIISGKKFR